MKTIELNSFYDFFELSEEESHSMIGTAFKEKGRDNLYFPIGLKNKWMNYGHPTGLIFVSPIHPSRNNYPEWFRCGLASPDDGDIDLDFIGKEEVKHRQKVIDFMKQNAWYDTSFEEVLKKVQEHVGAGKRTS